MYTHIATHTRTHTHTCIYTQIQHTHMLIAYNNYIIIYIARYLLNLYTAFCMEATRTMQNVYFNVLVSCIK